MSAKRIRRVTRRRLQKSRFELKTPEQLTADSIRVTNEILIDTFVVAAKELLKKPDVPAETRRMTEDYLRRIGR